jgi:hypothetical protein
MRPKWYGDNRDFVKWSVLIHLAKMNTAKRILQIAYFRDNDFDIIEIDGEKFNIPSEVKAHFRNIRKIEELSSPVKVSVFDTVFKNRIEYLDQAKKFISSFSRERCIVFLDPDTGLEPSNPNLNHLLGREVTEFWAILKPGDVLALYQHKTNLNNKLWVEPKRVQFERAIKVPEGTVKIAHGLKLARDVVLFYVHKA